MHRRRVPTVVLALAHDASSRVVTIVAPGGEHPIGEPAVLPAAFYRSAEAAPDLGDEVASDSGSGEPQPARSAAARLAPSGFTSIVPPLC